MKSVVAFWHHLQHVACLVLSQAYGAFHVSHISVPFVHNGKHLLMKCNRLSPLFSAERRPFTTIPLVPTTHERDDCHEHSTDQELRHYVDEQSVHLIYWVVKANCEEVDYG